MKRPKFKTAAKITITVLALAAIGGGWYWSRIQWIPAGYVGVIYNAASGLEPKIYPPKAVFVGWRKRLFTYPTRLMAAIYTQDPQAGEVKTADGILITTNDNANTTFDVAVMYRVKPDDVLKVFNSFGAIPIEEVQTLHIRRAVREAASVVGTQYDVFQLMGPKREEASQRMTEELQTRLAPKGITVETAMLAGDYPTADINQKITSRVNSFTELEISKLKQEIAEVERSKAVILAEAEQKAAALSSAQSGQRNVDLLKLEAAEAAIQRWNGELPPVSSKPGQTIVIGGNGLIGTGGK